MSSELRDWWRRANWSQRAVSSAAVILIGGALVVHNAANAALLLLFAVGLPAFGKVVHSANSPRRALFLSASFLAYFIVGVICYLDSARTRLGWEILFRDIRFVFVVPALLALVRFPPPRRLVQCALATAGLALGAVALWQFFVGGPETRASGISLPIVFGHLSVAVCLLLVLAWAADAAMARGDRWWAMAGAAGAAVAVVLSGTRGAWLVLLAALLPTLLIALRMRNALQWKRLVAVALTLVMMIAIAASVGMVRQRVMAAYAGLSDYVTGLRVSRSIDWTRHGCLSSEAFLRSYAASLAAKSAHSVRVSVVREPGVTAAAGCPAPWVLQLQNTSTKRSGRFLIPRSPTPGQADQAAILASGDAQVQFVRDAKSRQRIHQSGYSRIRLTRTKPGGGTVIGYIPPAGQFRFAPVQVSDFEYKYSYAQGSLGSRLEMWRAATRHFLGHPWLGVGVGAFSIESRQLVASGALSNSAARFDHAHSDVLTILAERGLLGAFSYLVLLGVPFWLGMGAIRRRRSLAGAGLTVFTVSFALSGLTETMLNHSLVITYYALMVSILFSRCQAEAGQRQTP